jgi:hypothetical protein
MRQICGFQSIGKPAIQASFVFPLQATSCIIRQLLALSKEGTKGRHEQAAQK